MSFGLATSPNYDDPTIPKIPRGYKRHQGRARVVEISEAVISIVF